MIPDTPTHHAFGMFSIRAPRSLPSLPVAVEEHPEHRIDLDWAASGAPDGIEWAHHWSDGDEVLLSLARQGESYWLRVPGYADFLVSLQPCTVWASRQGGALDGATLEHLLVDQILPRVLAQLGATVIHASTVRIGQRHVLFLGPSGWGKSTLAGLLHRVGHTVLSDDCIQIVTRPDGRFQAIPTYPSLRLNSDSLEALFPGQIDTTPVASYSNKRRIPIQGAQTKDGNAAIDAIYLLGDPAQADEAVGISAISPAAGCLALIKHSFRLDLADRAASALQLRQCGAIACAVPSFRLDYPRDHDRHAALLRAVLDHVSTLPPVEMRT